MSNRISISEHPVPGGWDDREVTIGPHTFRLFTPADPDEFLNHLESPDAAKHRHLADPYWAKLWPAAPLLAAAIVRAGLPRGTRMLELGCGSGLVGIAALAAGLKITFSDYVPLAVQLALENAARNGLLGAKGLVLDWRDGFKSVKEPFPFIAAADVTYDRSILDPLLNLLDQALAPGGEAWFGDAGRSPAEDFVERAKKCGWSVSLWDEHDDVAARCDLGQYRRIVLRRIRS